MISSINRRDFLKLAGLLPLSLAAPRWTGRLSAPASRKNVVVIVFDAFSALNISLYGYARDTTPNLKRLAKRAVVYHNHYAGSNFTTSGTASLLTGTLPWTHRALQPDGRVSRSFETRSLFDTFGDYYRAAYTHNSWAYTLLQQFHPAIEQLVPVRKLFLAYYDGFVESLFGKDDDVASVSWARDIKLQDGYSYSLFLSQIYKALADRQTASRMLEFPRGLPRPSLSTGGDFILEQAIDWVGSLVTAIPRPFLGYFHFLPPHDPYNTSRQFFNAFRRDGYEPGVKPVDIFATQVFEADDLRRLRREYDEYILYVDSQFQRFYNALEQSGLLDNTWLILTSDHGELIERGIMGHGSNALYQPLVRIPLMIFEPGGRVGMDIHAPTSAIDLLPTLAHITGHSIPDWAEGAILPPYAASGSDPDRPIYAVKAAANDPSTALTHASTMLVRGRHKLLYYFGYPSQGVDELVKLYNVQADPEEMFDLSGIRRDLAGELLNELKSKLAEANGPYV
ncbi:MAG TPA: sulfatase-like hydrolase/transferase [Anaerolineales bacterium]|nr:sulfatase-like hydrolase/transferase [Anaerolineales bacterium]